MLPTVSRTSYQTSDSLRNVIMSVSTFTTAVILNVHVSFKSLLFTEDQKITLIYLITDKL